MCLLDQGLWYHPGKLVKNANGPATLGVGPCSLVVTAFQVNLGAAEVWDPLCWEPGGELQRQSGGRIIFEEGTDIKPSCLGNHLRWGITCPTHSSAVVMQDGDFIL